MDFQQQKLVSASESATTAAIANLANMKSQMESKMTNNNCINYGGMLPSTNSLFNLHSTPAIAMNQKPVVGFESQQNVASMMPYMQMPIRTDTSMIYPSFSPLAAAAVAYYNANCQPQQASLNACSSSQSSNAAANLINAAFGVGPRFASGASNHSPPAAQQSLVSAVSQSNSAKPSLQADSAAFGCGMHVPPEVSSIGNSLIGSNNCNPFASPNPNVGVLPNPTLDTWTTAAAVAASYPYSTMSAYSMELGNARRKNATRETTSTLKAWLHEHIKNPYPSKGEKIMLAIITKMTLTQVSTWFANARRRLKKENKMIWSPRNRCETEEGGATSSANQNGSLDKFGFASCDRASPTSDDDHNSLSNEPTERDRDRERERERDRNGKSEAAAHYSRMTPSSHLAVQNMSQTTNGDVSRVGHASQQAQQPFAKIWSLAQTATISDGDSTENRAALASSDAQKERYLGANSKQNVAQAHYEAGLESAKACGIAGLSLLSSKNSAFSAIQDAQPYLNASASLGNLSKIVPEYPIGVSGETFANQNCAPSKWQLEAAGTM